MKEQMNMGVEFKRMAEQYGVPDKQVMTDVRTLIRQMWGNSPFKRGYLDKHVTLIENTNTRSKKRYPVVKKYKCTSCGEWYGSAEIELDHVISENSLTSYEHIDDFFKTIVFPSPKQIQILCKDKKLKGKVVHFGCHGIKTYSERYGVSLEEARVTKETLKIMKEKVDKEYLSSHNLPIPTTQAKRKELIIKHKLEQLEKQQ